MHLNTSKVPQNDSNYGGHICTSKDDIFHRKDDKKCMEMIDRCMNILRMNMFKKSLLKRHFYFMEPIKLLGNA